MSALKTKFPCRYCKAPSEVKRLKDAPHATCPRCVERTRCFSLVAHYARTSATAMREAHRAKTHVEILRAVCRASSASMRAAEECLAAVPSARGPGEKRHLIRVAGQWMARAESIAQKNQSHVEPALAEVLEAVGLAMVDGGGEAVSLEVEAPPALRLVPAEEGEGT